MRLKRPLPIYHQIQPLTSQSELYRLWVIIVEKAGELIPPTPPPEYTKYAISWEMARYYRNQTR
jgi:hypothetical protein